MLITFERGSTKYSFITMGVDYRHSVVKSNFWTEKVNYYRFTIDQDLFSAPKTSLVEVNLCRGELLPKTREAQLLKESAINGVVTSLVTQLLVCRSFPWL